ncbi:MAG: 16S rRNA (uracil(1498)-N(3))-methyltransferase [Geothermobacteraceae bacterium]
MRRFFLDPNLLTEDQIDLPDETLKHLKVLRLSVGDRIELLDGSGQVATARIEILNRQNAQVRIENRRQEKESALPVTLLQGLPKADKFDLILQKGTELGISRFVPVLTRRCQPDGGRRRLERWQRVAREAARQSGRLRLPELEEPMPLEQALAGEEGDLKLVAWEQAATPLNQVLADRRPQGVVLLIGPEGGFDPDEVARAQRDGYIPVSLGPRILRTETAGFVLAGILQYVYGDLNRPAPSIEPAQTCPEQGGRRDGP